MEATVDVRPTNVGQEINVDMTKITDPKIQEVRTALDAVSWTLLDHEFISPVSSPLRVDYLNSYIIEGYNWFAGTGIYTFFRNRELEFKHGIIRFTDAKLERPRTDKQNPDGSPVLMYPNYARLNGESYSGALTLTGDIHWKANGAVEKDVRFKLGYVPMMKDCAYCNLSLIQDVKGLTAVQEHSCDYGGYFIIKGNERNLISQNYLKANNEIVITSKMGSSQTGRRTCCNNRSMGLDGMQSLHRLYIASNNSSKIAHGDRRIYVQMPWTKANVYDKGGASSTGISAIGVNIYTIFRMTKALIYTLDPTEPIGNYSVITGYGGNSTLYMVLAEFNTLMNDYGGEKLMRLAQNYMEDTYNEATVEEDEKVFWERTYKASGLNLDNPTQDPLTGAKIKSVPKKVKDNEPAEAQAEVPLSNKVAAVLKMFGEQFFPHLATRPFAMQRRDLEVLKASLRLEIKAMHDSVGVRAENTDASDRLIDESLKSLRELVSAGQQFAGFKAMAPNDPNKPTPEALQNMGFQIDAFREQLRTARGIVLGPRFKIYEDALLKISELKKDMDTRLAMLAYMAIRVLRVEMSIDTYDDRDNLSNQVYEHPGMLMMSRLISMTNEIAGLLDPRKGGAKENNLLDSKSVVAFLEKAADAAITKGFIKNFADGNWNAKKANKPRTGVTDIMPASVTSARLSYLRRVSAQSGGHSKNTSARELVGLQIGGICPSETPEGTQCGNVEHLATAAFLTNESSDSKTLAHKLTKIKTSARNFTEAEIGQMMHHKNLESKLEGLRTARMAQSTEYVISSHRSAQRNCPLFLNGRPMGWVDGLWFRRTLIEERRQGLIHPHTGVHYSHKASRAGMINYLKIETGGGRIVQPLIIAEDPQKTVNSLWRLITADANSRISSITDLIAQGIIEYIDSAELEFLDVAPSISDYLRSVKEGMPERYDHIMLNPAFLMGVAANLMPFAEMNPVVRNSYFTQMVKQPIDVPLPTYQERIFTGVSVLHTPQVPLVTTDVYTRLFKNDYWGMNPRLLIMPHMNGEEDGVVIRRGFLNNGGLSSTKYSIFSMDIEKGHELSFTDDFMEQTEGPERYGRGVIRPTKEVVDAAGVVRKQKVVVRPNEILARKLTAAGNVVQFKDLKYESLRDGIVDKVMLVKTNEYSKKLHVSIEYPDNLIVGDKIAARYSQKGVIADIVEDEDMPYDPETGETADIILNPQAFPSRMTVGMLAEILVANAYAYPDKNKVYGTLYRERGMDIFCPFEQLFIVDEVSWNNHREGTEIINPVGDLVNEVRPGMPTRLIVVTSEDALSQSDFVWLSDHNAIKTLTGFSGSLPVLKFYGDRQAAMTTVEVKKRSGQRVSIQEAKAFTPRGAKYMIVTTGQNLTPEAMNNLGELINRNGLADSFYTIPLDLPQNAIEQIPEIYYDETKQSLMLGIRLSRLPTDVILAENNPFSQMGNSIQEIYLQGNWTTPVPTQFIAGYLPSFFSRKNLAEFYFDFGLPAESLPIPGYKVVPPGGMVAQDIILKPDTRYSMLAKETTPITITDPITGVVSQTTIAQIWDKTYPGTLMVPRENVVGLPTNARDIYTIRKVKIDSLRRATIFKEGMDVNDAMRELKMMGYNEDMTKTFVDPRTGKDIANGMVTGFSYYMPLKHKAKNKIQGRGLGRKEQFTHQPIAGRNFEGGMRFNYGDALATYKSGAVNFVADRLLNASKTDAFVCSGCGEVCYKEGGGLRGLVCPSCKTSAKVIKISVPYVFLVIRNMLAAAGVNLKIEAMADKADDNDD